MRKRLRKKKAKKAAENKLQPFQHYMLPLMRRVYPNLIANSLVGVQPMTSPSSLVHYLKYKFGPRFVIGDFVKWISADSSFFEIGEIGVVVDSTKFKFEGHEQPFSIEIDRQDNFLAKATPADIIKWRLKKQNVNTNAKA